MSSHTSLAQVLSLITTISIVIHGAPSLTRFSLSTSTCSSLSFPSTSSTPSCTLRSTTRSLWKACATPPTRRVRTPTTSPPPSQFSTLIYPAMFHGRVADQHKCRLSHLLNSLGCFFFLIVRNFFKAMRTFEKQVRFTFALS